MFDAVPQVDGFYQGDRNLYRLAVIWHRLGPYHMARLRALGKHSDLTAIEMSGEDNTYAWNKTVGGENFRRLTVFPTCDCDTRPRAEIAARLFSTLNDVKPDIVAIPSWGESYALMALDWSLATNTHNLVMTDSNVYDKSRSWWKEAIKRRIVRFFQSGLVSSTDHRTYLESLGMPRERIFFGYNVVDNAYFAEGAATAVQNRKVLAEKFQVPERFFLCSARFVEKKNLFRLLDAFALYKKRAGESAWPLVLLGDGPLRAGLEQHREKLGLSKMVMFPGFKQYAELPFYYGLASVFVLASTEEQWGNVVNESMVCGLPVLVSNKCGCAPTLVKEGQNGYLFDPLQAESLAVLLLKCSNGEFDLTAMGKASREIINTWNPDTFAENMIRAVDCSLAQAKPSASFLDRQVLRLLARTR